MAQGRGNALVLALALFALLQVAAAKDYIVGDSVEWSYPPGTDLAFYDAWAKKYTFAPGDNLVFNYGVGQHDVQIVSAAEYAGCLRSTGKKYLTGSDSIALPKAGDYYFLCSIFTHCEQGMKMKVTVAATAAPPTAAPPTVAPATPPATRPATPPVRTPAPAPVLRAPVPAPVRAPVPSPVEEPAAVPEAAPTTAPTPLVIVPVAPAPAPAVETSAAQATRVCLSVLAVAAAFAVLLL